MKIRSILSLFIMALLLSCSTNSTDDLLELSTTPISYNSQVKNIIETNCLFCHSSPPVNFAPMQLTTYDDVKNAILTRGLIDRISRPQGAPGMMPNGGTRLPQALIDQITGRVRWRETMQWASDNAITHIYEVGAGKVLSSMCKRAVKDAQIFAINTYQDMQVFETV